MGGVRNGVTEEDLSRDLNPGAGPATLSALLGLLTVRLGKEKTLDHLAAVRGLGHMV